MIKINQNVIWKNVCSCIIHRIQKVKQSQNQADKKNVKKTSQNTGDRFFLKCKKKCFLQKQLILMAFSFVHPNSHSNKHMKKTSYYSNKRSKGLNFSKAFFLFQFLNSFQDSIQYKYSVSMCHGLMLRNILLKKVLQKNCIQKIDGFTTCTVFV